MAASADWKEWIDGPLGHALRGATYGGGLGWVYDKIRDKKNKGKDAVRRIVTGALLGSIAGSGLSSYEASDKEKIKSKVRDMLDSIRAYGK